MHYKRDMLIGLLCVAVLLAVGWFCTGEALSSGGHPYDGLPHLTIKVDARLQVLGATFNGPGRPVLFVKEKSTGDLGMVQYQDQDGDKVFEPAFVYNIEVR